MRIVLHTNVSESIRPYKIIRASDGVLRGNGSMVYTNLQVSNCFVFVLMAVVGAY